MTNSSMDHPKGAHPFTLSKLRLQTQNENDKTLGTIVQN
jgi:hypothetical protein